MLPFRINLIRSQTIPPAARRRLFVAMIGYLALCGCLLVAVSHQAARRWVAIQQMREQMDLLEERFLVQHPEEKDIARYGRILTRQLNHASRQVETVVNLFDRRIQTAKILLDLSRQLPEGMDIIDVKLDAVQKTLEFSLAAPSAGSGESSDSEHLLAAWNGDQELMKQVGHISSIKSQRQMMDGVPVYLLSFSSRIQ